MMGTNRSTGLEVHPSRRPNIDDHHNKRRKNNFHDTGAQTSNPQSINALKEKVRDLTRMLDHSKNLPANVRLEKERALAGYQSDLEAAQSEKRRSDLIKKYHMVRFFERQKATRALKKIQKQFSAMTPSDTEYLTLEQAVHEAEVDRNYTMYYPLEEKYRSLYPRKDHQASLDEEKEEGIGGRGLRGSGNERPPLWLVVERAMAEGTLEALRDRRSQSVVVDRQKPNAPVDTSKHKIRAGNKTNVLNLGDESRPGGGAVTNDDKDEDLSDGGFFER